MTYYLILTYLTDLYTLVSLGYLTLIKPLLTIILYRIGALLENGSLQINKLVDQQILITD